MKKVLSIIIMLLCASVGLSEEAFNIEGEWYYLPLDQYSGIYRADMESSTGFRVHLYDGDIVFGFDGQVQGPDGSITLKHNKLANNAYIYLDDTGEQDYYAIIFERNDAYAAISMQLNDKALFIDGEIIADDGIGNSKYIYSSRKLFAARDGKYASGTISNYGNDFCVFDKDVDSSGSFLNFYGDDFSMIFIRTSVLENLS